MRGGTDTITHSEWLVAQWNSVVTKQDRVWVLGDVCFDKKHMKYLGQMRGQKTLILGNHDTFKVELYKEYFNRIYGLYKKDNIWFSHAPIHAGSLRNGYNIHGHLHERIVEDPHNFSRYFNVSVERCRGIPIEYERVKYLLEYGTLLCNINNDINTSNNNTR